jgi:transcriptional regulator with XRE-family HTH domain
MSDMTLQIGRVLSAIIKERRLTLKEIATGAGVPLSTISEWTNNRAPKNPIQVQKVAGFLGVSMHFLLFGQEDQEEPITKLLKEEVFSGTFEITVKRVKTK